MAKIALAEPGDRDPASRLVVNFTQIQTFLTLVEEGSVTRASQRLGLGHSTVSAHIKAIGEEFAQSLFTRLHGGVVVTTAGLEAYGRLRSLVARASFCIDYFRNATVAPPTHVRLAMPHGLPGSPLDIAVLKVARQGVPRAPEVCLLPVYGKDCAVEDSPVFSYGGSAGESARPVLRDRWVLVRAKANAGSAAETVLFRDLAGLGLLVPKLPASLLGNVLALADRTKASLEWSNVEVHEVLGRAAETEDFCAIFPASLLNHALIGQHFDCALLEASELDPTIRVRVEPYPAVAELISEKLGTLLSDPPFGSPATERPVGREERESLSLKHCRSFLALFEEGNVRRAAQRLCIVQPALTVQLHRIEEQVGCRLFTRSHHGLRATARAETLYALLRPLMTDINAAVRELRMPVDRQSRRVRIGSIPALDDESLTAECFAGALDKWSGSHADSVVQVVEAYSSTLVRWLSAGKIDFALIDRPFPDPSLIFDPIAEDTMVVVVNSASALLRPGPVRLDQLVDLPLVLPSSCHGLRALITQHLREKGLALQPRIEVDSLAGALSLVKMARYATILPMASVYKSRDRRQLAIHEIVEPQIRRNICLARARTEPRSEAASHFIDELRSAFARAGTLFPLHAVDAVVGPELMARAS